MPDSASAQQTSAAVTSPPTYRQCMGISQEKVTNRAVRRTKKGVVSSSVLSAWYCGVVDTSVYKTVKCVCAVWRAYPFQRAVRRRQKRTPLESATTCVYNARRAGTLAGRYPCTFRWFRGNGGVADVPVQVPSDEDTGDPAATLTDNGQRPKLLTYHPGWFPKLHELPGMIKDSTLAVARSGTCPSMRLCRERVL